jgi:hypothetical protein
MLGQFGQYLVVLLVVGGLVVLAIYLVRQEWQLVQRLAAYAREQGWSFMQHPANQRAFIIKSAHGELDWQIEIYRSGRHQSSLTLWQTGDACLPGGPVLVGANIGDLYTSDGAQQEAQERVTHLGWQLLSRTDGWGSYLLPYPLGLTSLGINPAGLDVQQVGSPVLNERFSVLSATLESAQRLLSPQVEQLLLDWSDNSNFLSSPLVIASQEGIELRLQHERVFQQHELLDQMVGLGLALAMAVNSNGRQGE